MRSSVGGLSIKMPVWWCAAVARLLIMPSVPYSPRPSCRCADILQRCLRCRLIQSVVWNGTFSDTFTVQQNCRDIHRAIAKCGISCGTSVRLFCTSIHPFTTVSETLGDFSLCDQTLVRCIESTQTYHKNVSSRSSNGALLLSRNKYLLVITHAGH